MVKVKESIRIDADREITLEDWLVLLRQERPDLAPDRLRAACALLQDTFPDSGPAGGEGGVLGEGLAMADVLADMRLDPETLAAALLYPCVRDDVLELETVTERVGEGVSRLLGGIRQMNAIHDIYQNAGDRRRDGGHAENLRKMLLAMVEDVRVVLVKLAERVVAMRLARDADEPVRRDLARETQEVYAPLANRLGIGQIKWELEDLAFRFLEPATYKQIARLLEERRVDRERYIRRVMDQMRESLASAGIQAEVHGRAKHIYSIWRKMQRKSQDFHQIHDVRALRVLVDSIPDCYATLGIVHTLWAHIPREFDDYIATPKENGYRSLHTAVIGPEGRNLEVQIRTHEMDSESELGVAAHWRYKEGMAYDSSFEAKIAWLRQILNWQEELSDTEALLDDLKSAVVEERVYVFTPQGKVVDMPVGATPLDFAYHIHTELGHRCRGAKINGRIVPLTYRLQTGEQVEILTAKEGAPSRDWLNPNLGYLNTGRARGKVQHWFRLQDHDKNCAAGRAAMEREQQRLGLGPIDYETIAGKYNFKRGEDLLAAVGAGDIRPGQVVTAHQVLQRQEPPQSELPLPISRPSTPTSDSDVHIQGVGNLLTHMARCCKPVPGDAIMGYITRGRGVTIHRRDCPNVLEYQRREDERLIEVEWGGQTRSTYPVDVYIKAYDRHGLLRDITSLLANDRINVTAVNTLSDKEGNTADMTLTLEINGLDQLGRVLDQINQLPNVIEVHRRH